ncbi:MAG TPA: hypothetical protein VD930_00045, partial [Gemmatimonadales bacterium]|nr:hypothetical protein [Gemmatimonadales bacterium]
MNRDRLPADEQELMQSLADRLREPVPLSDRVEREVFERIRLERNGGLRRPSPRRHFLPLALAAGIAAVFALGVLVG